MAKYIDKEQIRCHRERVLNHWSGSRHTDCDVSYKDIVTSEEIGGIPTADVVEREKIEKALEQTYKVREMVLHSNRMYEANDVLDIIDEISACFEKHIGE